MLKKQEAEIKIVELMSDSPCLRFIDWILNALPNIYNSIIPGSLSEELI